MSFLHLSFAQPVILSEAKDPSAHPQQTLPWILRYAQNDRSKLFQFFHSHDHLSGH
jgi:hypothetical protein